MNIVEGLKKHSAESKIAMIIRHGDREKIPAGEYGNDVLLNQKGQENSFKLGESLRPFQVNKILTSPIQRCIQTAEFLKKGYGREVEITQTQCLGAPGLHITDDVLAGEYFLKHGFFKILDEFIEGKSSPGLRDKLQYEKAMTDFIRSNTQKSGLTIYVTHDSLIALYHYCLNGTIYTTQNWVKYLDGVLLNISTNEK